MNIKAILAILQIVGSLVLAWLQQRPRENTDAEQKAQASNDKLQQHYDEIDSREPDFDAAISRLRERSSRGRSAGTSAPGSDPK